MFGIKEIFENRKEIYRTHLNGVVNRGISELNYELIRTTLIDYDLSQKKMTKTILKDATRLSLSTIKNYLKNYPELKGIYQSIKDNSGTLNKESKRSIIQTKWRWLIY